MRRVIVGIENKLKGGSFVSTIPRIVVPVFAVLILVFALTAFKGDMHPAADKLFVHWQVVDNLISVGDVKEVFLGRLTIENRDVYPLQSSGWRLYFTSVRPPASTLPSGNAVGDYSRQMLAAQGVSISRADVAQSGDYFVLDPLTNFSPIPPGQSRSIDVLCRYWQILKCDSPSAFHIVFDGEPPRAVFTSVSFDPADPKQTTALDQSVDVRPVQTPQIRYGENTAQCMDLNIKEQILPRPLSVAEGVWYLYFYSHIAIIQYPSVLENEAWYLEAALEDLMAGDIAMSQNGSAVGSYVIDLSIDPGLDVDNDGTVDAEGYTLEVDDLNGIDIVGADASGVLYGIQTLRQLIPASVYKNALGQYKPWHAIIPEVVVADAPRFEHRGMLLDVSRHFQSKETVFKLLDLLAFFKMNKLQLTVANDEGWRLEIPGIPELTEYGARRGFDLEEENMLHVSLGSFNDLLPGDSIVGKPSDLTEANAGKYPAFQGFEQAMLNYLGKGWGYYTVADFKEILSYAAERHIDVILEFDFPAHARAAIQSMEYRYRKYDNIDKNEAERYRLIDPEDTSYHETPQFFTDNFVNPALESTYRFLTKVVTEVKKMYDAVPGAEMVAFHGGGDELPSLQHNTWWQDSPAVQSNPETTGKSDRELADYFTSRFLQIVTSAGLTMEVWGDLLYKNCTGTVKYDNVIPVFWNNVWTWGDEDRAYYLANDHPDVENDNYKIILAHATNNYLDLCYNKDPDEPGYHWAGFVDTKKTFEYCPYNIYVNAYETKWGAPYSPDPTWEKLTETGKKNVLGIQGQLWGENQKHPKFLEYFAFPKVLGVAERAWTRDFPSQTSKNARDESFKLFCNTLGQSVLPRLGFYQAVDMHNQLPQEAGVNYRIPLPGAKIMCRRLYANIRFPGLSIEYSKDGGHTWYKYSRPVRVCGTVLLRSRSQDGRFGRVAEIR